jgi:hypothetical protein
LIIIACFKCNIALRTSGDEEEVHTLLGAGSEWYPNKYPCPRFGCTGLAEYSTGIQPTALAALELHEVTPQEAFAAFEGLGLPPERDCGETAVRGAFEKKVTNVGVRQLRGRNRSVIDWIEFEDGTRLFLAASGDGAVAYRLAKKFSYVEKNQ